MAGRLTAALFLVLGACSSGGGGPVAPGAGPDTAKVPLPELAGGSYLGFRGGLYPEGNTPPAAHAAAGRASAARVVPRDAQGRPAAAGKIVLLSVGMSNTTQEFCSGRGTLPCDPWTFVGQAGRDPAVNRATLVLANGAVGGQVAETWDRPSLPNYDHVRDDVLHPQGLTEAQVQVVWLKVANAQPRTALPAAGADAYALQASMGASRARCGRGIPTCSRCSSPAASTPGTPPPR
ncbi:MAG TPA: hypothetical protein VF710_21920 [Longimicrobium sp.]|jgi:hypothetical protein